MSQLPATRTTGNVVVIGGGITGLSAAFSLQQASAAAEAPFSITLVEADGRLGGKIVTDHVDGFTIEGGPDCFLRQKPAGAELAVALGLEPDLIGTNDRQRRVYVVNRGRLTPMPDGVMLIVPTRILPFALSPLISWPGKLRMGLDWFIPARRGGGDESVGDFIRRRLGREALDKLAEPLMSGIHVSDPEKQSLMATFPRYRAIEERHGSLIRGMLAERRRAGRPQPAAAGAANGKPASMFLSFKQGLGQLVGALEGTLTGCRVLKGTRVTAIRPTPDGAYVVTLSGGQRLDADAVILTAPAYAAADLLEGLSPRAAGLLRTIPYVSTATISLAYRQRDLPRPLTGSGFVIPRSEARGISACTWSSLKFDGRAPDGALLLRCFIGGPGKEAQVELDDAALIHAARAELEALLGLRAEPLLTRIYRWRKANPQYEVGHLERVAALFAACDAEAPGIFLAGSGYEGVGIPDCIAQGQQAAAQAAAYLARERVTA